MKNLVDLILSKSILSICDSLSFSESTDDPILYGRDRSPRVMIGLVKCLLPAVKTKESELAGRCDGDHCSVYRT